MYSIIGSNIIYNIIEYFSFINIFLSSLFIIISIFYILSYSSTLYYSGLSYNYTNMNTSESISTNNSTIELICTLFCLLFLLLIIAPSLIILCDIDLVVMPTFIVYSLGIQWAWEFNIVFCPIDTGYNAYCDHYIIISSSSSTNISANSIWTISTINILPNDIYFNVSLSLLSTNSISTIIISSEHTIESIISSSILGGRIMSASPISTIPLYPNSISTIIIGADANIIDKLPYYLWDVNSYILIPLFGFIKVIVYSFDVIHTLGFYSWGIKIDAIPARINLSTTLRPLGKGQFNGTCYELCGQGHLSMLLLSVSM